MVILISPAKKLDFQSRIDFNEKSQPFFLAEADELAECLSAYSASDLEGLMSISTQLARLNFERYQMWKMPNTPERQAIYAYKGDVYQGIDVSRFSKDDLNFATKHLRILSGLYGYLRPLDMIKPYRLEMGISIQSDSFQDLYEFWKPKITTMLQEELRASGNQLVFNLASKEYASVVDYKWLQAKVISPEFKDYKNGRYTIVSFYAKKARGRMSAFIIKNRITDADDLAAFSEDGYTFNNQLSTQEVPVFTRG